MGSKSQYVVTTPKLKIGFMSTSLSPAALTHEVSMAWKTAASEVFTATCSEHALNHWRAHLEAEDFPLNPTTGESDPDAIVHWLRTVALTPSETPISVLDSPSGKCCAVDDFGRWERTRHFGLSKGGSLWTCDEILTLYVQNNSPELSPEVAAELAALPVMGFLSWMVGSTISS